MRKAVLPFVLSVGLIAVWAAPAEAASTRAEYIAQVDPICQAAAAPLSQADQAVSKSYKSFLRPGTYSVKQFSRKAKRLARSMNRRAAVYSSVTEQIAAVPPPAEDAATVSAWLDHRRQAATLERSAASALTRLALSKAAKRIRQAGAADDAADKSISGFGFKFCHVVT
jgi:hypothetical protein